MRPDPILVALTGPAGSGKDTAAELLSERHGFERYAFADPIKDMLTALLVGAGLDYAYLFERRLKELPIPYIGHSGRRLMQTLGTEWGRAIDPDLWVNLAALQLGLHDLPRSAPIHDRIVITDLRFPNEAEWVRRMGGLVVRVVRDVPAIAAHESEAHTRDMRADHEILNTGTLADLADQVAEFAAPFAPIASDVVDGEGSAL
jgi:hypothetical protein